jgi:hypothetical protein
MESLCIRDRVTLVTPEVLLRPRFVLGIDAVTVSGALDKQMSYLRKLTEGGNMSGHLTSYWSASCYQPAPFVN